MSRHGNTAGHCPGAQRAYILEYSVSTPSSSAACQAQRGSNIMPRASATMFALPPAMMSSAWRALVIIPTV